MISENLKATFKETLYEFEIHLTMQLGRSKNTVVSYLKDIELFALFLQKKKLSSFDELSVENFLDYASEISREIKATSQSRKISALKNFCIFLMEEKRIEKDFSQFLMRPKTRRAVPSALEVDDIEKLIAATDSETFEGIRDRAMLELMYSSGLRVSELCAVRFSDFDLYEKILRVKGKGSKTRLVPFGKDAYESILNYKKNALPNVKKVLAEEFFITRRGTKLSRKSFWFNIKRYALLANVEKNVKPHGLRHSFATHLLQNGANLISIQEMLGHSDLSTTQIYTELSKDALIDEYKKFHPRSK